MAGIWKANYWLYKFIPRTWAEAGWWPHTWLLWALFGNDHDGIFGEYTSKWWDEHGAQPSFWLFLKWQFRNPLSNLMKFTLAWRGLPFSDGIYSYLIAQWNEKDGWRFYRRKSLWMWDQAGRQFSIAVLPPNIQYRGKHIETYSGWAKGETYKLGFALRAAYSTSA